MQELQKITIKKYLIKRSIPFREANGELITKCLFASCDKDSTGNEAHLYLSIETGQYHCKKCGSQGNIFTLAKHFGDTMQEIALNPIISNKNLRKPTKFDTTLVESCHQALPANIRQYLNARGITGAVVNVHKLGWGKFYGRWWLTIPIKDSKGSYAFLKLRRDPEDTTNPDKYKFYPAGSKATIFGLDMLKGDEDRIVICEGEFDCLLLAAHGIPAITSTAGAETFKDEWIDSLKSIKQIYVCFDNDDTGRKGADNIIRKLFETKRHQVYLITLPQEVGDHGDITNYFIEHKGTESDLFGKLAKECLLLGQTPRIRKVDPPLREISFEEWRETIRSNFPDLLTAAEIGISIITQLLIKDITNPFALVLVDVPAAGKTIAINFFSEIEGLTYATDKFTPAAFVSNAANVKKEKLKEIDLLPRLQYKMFLLRDMATIFSKRDDDLAEAMGLLTRLLDGEGLNTESGVHGERHYVGEYLFMMFAASTPLQPKVWKLMGNLGSRLFFYNTNAREKSEEELVDQVITSSHKEKEKKCRSITQQFLQTLWHKHQDGIDWDKHSDDRSVVAISARCAHLLATLRGVVNVWKDRGDDGIDYNYTVPIVEMANRINQLFYNLARGHALACGRNQINKDDLKLIIEIAFDSTITTRSRLFRNLIEYDGEMKTSEVESILRCSTPTAHKEMETLRVLGVCSITENSDGEVGQPEKVLHLCDKFNWFLSDECRAIRELSPTPKQEIKQQDTFSDLFSDNQ